jgi:sulfur carrier protein
MVKQIAAETRGIAVAINGEVIRRGEWSTTLLHDGDVVEIVNAVAGG